MKRTSANFTFPPFECPADVLITPRSHFIDRIVPECEIIHLPSKSIGGGEFWCAWAENQSSIGNENAGLRRYLPRFISSVGAVEIQAKTFFDFRRGVPQNWAHFLNDHLPIYFAIAHELGLVASDTVLILPKKTPSYIQRAAALFGLDTLCTDAPVSGDAMMFQTDQWVHCRAVRAEWAHLPFATEALNSVGVRDCRQGALPNRAFLSRRNTRYLENEAEIEAFLAVRGYTKVYPEDLTVADQFKLFEQAEHIVAIHGAGLAPLLYRSASSRLTGLIELFPCSHMTDNFRVMTHQVGCAWVGVRGKIKPEHVDPAYDLTQPFVKYSLQSFEVDVRALENALTLDAERSENA